MPNLNFLGIERSTREFGFLVLVDTERPPRLLQECRSGVIGRYNALNPESMFVCLFNKCGTDSRPYNSSGLHLWSTHNPQSHLMIFLGGMDLM